MVSIQNVGSRHGARCIFFNDFAEREQLISSVVVHIGVLSSGRVERIELGTGWRLLRSQKICHVARYPEPGI